MSSASQHDNRARRYLNTATQIGNSDTEASRAKPQARRAVRGRPYRTTAAQPSQGSKVTDRTPKHHAGTYPIRCREPDT